MIDDCDDLTFGYPRRGLVGVVVIGQDDLAVGLFGQVPAQQHTV